jgi:hypothetical protein
VTLIALAFAAASTAGAASDRSAGCSRPLTYDVVRVDPQFHLSRPAFVALLERAERLWEVPMKRDLLRYEPGGEVHVSLIYDSRTTAYLAREQSAKTIDVKDALITRERADMDRMDRELDKRALEIKTRRAALNKRVDYWNAKGGAPAKLYAALRAEDDAIAKLAAAFSRDLEREQRAQISFNSLVSARNALAAQVGKGAIELGRAKRGGNVMELFALTGNSAKDATLAAHEFGHILGLAHVPGVHNIMNPYLVGPLNEASPEDLAALQRVCGGEAR